MVDSKADIKNKLQCVFREIFDDDSIEIFDKMTARDIPDWDSLMHITLIVAVEKKFNIRLNAAEIGKLADVGEMINLISIRGK